MGFCSTCGTLCVREAKFCHNCGEQASATLEDGQEDSELDIITEYFHRGYPYNVIVGFLEKHHGIRMHVRTLKRKLRQLDLKRREPKYDEDIVREVIKREIQGSGSLVGYRYIWHALRLRYHMNVPRNVVASMMKEIDPDGVKERVSRRLTRRNYVSRGPNFCWHIDGYDKLKPYGFPIHGCICGYSRRIIWLELVKSNNNPKIIARLFLDAVQNANGCPRLVRSDCGTENVLVAAMQSYFRANGNDEFAASKAHQYGSSPSNQRIEDWWSFFRRSNSNWWINCFKDMCESGILELGNSFHMECLWFCFSRVIQKELDEVVQQWNSHYIRRSHHDTVAGVPDILYFLPENSDAVDCLIPISKSQIQEVEPQCEMEMEEDVYYEYFEYIMVRKGWHYPNTVSEAFNLYQCLNQLQADV